MGGSGERGNEVEGRNTYGPTPYTSTANKARNLKKPLFYFHREKKAALVRFKPTTSCFQGSCSTY